MTHMLPLPVWQFLAAVRWLLSHNHIFVEHQGGALECIGVNGNLTEEALDTFPAEARAVFVWLRTAIHAPGKRELDAVFSVLSGQGSLIIQ